MHRGCCVIYAPWLLCVASFCWANGVSLRKGGAVEISNPSGDGHSRRGDGEDLRAVEGDPQNNQATQSLGCCSLPSIQIMETSHCCPNPGSGEVPTSELISFFSSSFFSNSFTSGVKRSSPLESIPNILKR
jgi:hypothetical protein